MIEIKDYVPEPHDCYGGEHCNICFKPYSKPVITVTIHGGVELSDKRKTEALEYLKAIGIILQGWQQPWPDKEFVFYEGDSQYKGFPA